MLESMALVNAIVRNKLSFIIFIFVKIGNFKATQKYYK